MDRGNVLTAWFVFFLILTAAMPVHALFFAWPPRTYGADKAVAEIRKAEASNNLNEVARYLGNALKELEPYQGNPCWWYPTAQTNWDRIRENLKSLKLSAETLEANPSSFSYQQMLHNLEDELAELRKQIGDTCSWITLVSLDSFFFQLLWGVLWIALLIAALKEW